MISLVHTFILNRNFFYNTTQKGLPLGILSLPTEIKAVSVAPSKERIAVAYLKDLKDGVRPVEKEKNFSEQCLVSIYDLSVDQGCIVFDEICKTTGLDLINDLIWSNSSLMFLAANSKGNQESS